MSALTIEPGTGAVFGQASLDFVMGKEQKKKATLAGSKTKLETSRDAGFKLSKEKTTEGQRLRQGHITCAFAHCCLLAETQFRSGDRSKTLKSTSLGRNQKIHSVETLKSQWWYESVASWLGLEANTRIFCTSCRRRLSLSKDGSGNTESKMSTALSLEELKNLESDLFATEGFRFDIVPSHLLHSHVKNHRVDPTHINAVAFLESFDKGELSKSLLMML